MQWHGQWWLIEHKSLKYLFHSWNQVFLTSISCYCLSLICLNILFAQVQIPFITQETIRFGILSSDKPKLLPSKKSMYILHWFCCLLSKTQLLQSSPLYLKVDLKSIIPLVRRQKYTRHFQLWLVFPHTMIIKCNAITSCMLLTHLKI